MTEPTPPPVLRATQEPGQRQSPLSGLLGGLGTRPPRGLTSWLAWIWCRCCRQRSGGLEPRAACSTTILWGTRSRLPGGDRQHQGLRALVLRPRAGRPLPFPSSPCTAGIGHPRCPPPTEPECPALHFRPHSRPCGAAPARLSRGSHPHPGSQGSGPSSRQAQRARSLLPRGQSPEETWT